MKIIRPLQISDASMISNNVLEDGYERWSSTTTYAAGDTVLLENPSNNVTVTIASPCVVTWPNHNLSVGDITVFRTSGTLPTGVSSNVPYYLVGIVNNSTIASPSVGANPFGSVYCPSTNKIYITNLGSGYVSILDPTNNTVSATTITVGTAPMGITYCPSNDRLYVANYGGVTVSVINPADNSVTAITVGASSTGVAYCPSNNRVYVTHQTGGTVSVIRPDTATVVATITVGTSPTGVAYFSDIDSMVVCNYGTTTISIISATTNLVTDTVTVGTNPRYIAHCPTTSEMYVVNEGSNTVSILSTQKSVVNTISLVNSPGGIAYCPTTNRIYVAIYASTIVAIINPFSGVTALSATVGISPSTITYCPTSDRLYVTNSGTFGTVSVVSIAQTFTFSATEGGTPINSSDTQSGTHSAQALLSPTSSRVSISKTSPSVIGWSGHGFYNDDEITLYATGSLPTGFLSATTYYITKTTADTFQLTTSLGGSSIAATSDGSGVFFCVAKHHKIYESLTAGNLNNPPHKYPANWSDMGADNRWRMFDLSNTSQTRNADSLTCDIKARGRVDSVALMNLSAASVTITGTDAVAGIVYGPTTYLMNDNSGVGDWWTYFFEPIVYKKDWVDTDFPPYNDLLFHITLTNTGATAAVGAMVFGLSKTLGTTQYGANVGILDYSIKQRDTVGNYSILERAFSKRARFTLWLDNSLVDSVVNTLTTYRATPAVYVGTSDYQSTIVYGFYKDFNMDISYPTVSVCSIDVEGLT